MEGREEDSRNKKKTELVLEIAVERDEVAMKKN